MTNWRNTCLSLIKVKRSPALCWELSKQSLDTLIRLACRVLFFSSKVRYKSSRIFHHVLLQCGQSRSRDVSAWSCACALPHSRIVMSTWCAFAQTWAPTHQLSIKTYSQTCCYIFLFVIFSCRMYTANILTVLSTAFGSVMCATVIWLCMLQS